MATSKVIKEIITDVGGNTTIEYSDDTTQKYNVADVVTAQVNPLTGGIKFQAGDVFGNLSAPATRFASDIRARKKGFTTRPPVLMFHGDSNFSGQGAGTVGSPDRLFDAFRFTVSQRVKDYCPTLGGLPVKTTAFFGEGNSRNNAGVNAAQYDPRMFYSGAGWYAPAANGIGGSMFVCNSGQPGYLGVNFGESVDTVEVHFAVNTGLSDSVGVYSSDNTLIGSYSCAGAAGAGVATFTSSKFSDGIVKIKNNATNSGVGYCAGVLAWNSAVPCVLVVNASSVGATTSFFSYDPLYPWVGRGFYQTIKPSLSVIALTINDINTSVSAATYNTNLAAIVAMAQRYGDVILGTGQPCNNTPWTTGTLSRDIEAEMFKVAATYGAIGTASMQKELGSWSAANAIGFEYDSHHGTDLNYFYQAGIYASMIAKAADYGM